MLHWNNLDTLTAFEKLKAKKGSVNLPEAMAGESGAQRVAKYTVPMACGLAYNYAAKAVDDELLSILKELAQEAQLEEKYAALYNGEMINTGEKRLVLHQLTRGQLGDAVVVDGVDKRAFYAGEQKKAAQFAQKVHGGEIANADDEKFTTVVQIGIGGSDLGPRAMYLALENWAKENGACRLEARFISNVDPDDAANVLKSIDLPHSLFVLVSKSGTTLETLTNETFVKNALRDAGLDPSKHMVAVTSETSPLAKSDEYLAAFFMDDFIGGRYSSTSCVGGVVLSLAFGPEVFARFLSGAHAADLTAKESDLMKNPSMLDALNQDYVRTARAKGVPMVSVIFKHALRNALIPVITYVGPMLAYILTGSLVVENIFTIGGLGQQFVKAISNRDYPLIMATTIFLAVVMVICNLLSDIAYKIVDPRITLD